MTSAKPVTGENAVRIVAQLLLKFAVNHSVEMVLLIESEARSVTMPIVEISMAVAARVSWRAHYVAMALCNVPSMSNVNHQRSLANLDHLLA